MTQRDPFIDEGFQVIQHISRHCRYYWLTAGISFCAAASFTIGFAMRIFQSEAFVPFYFSMMNFAAYAGALCFLRGEQLVG